MRENIRLVQLGNSGLQRKLALVQEPFLILLNNFSTAYDLILEVIKTKTDVRLLIENTLSSLQLEYDLVYEGKTDWKILPSFDCPQNPFACLVSGTGLTHKNSALNRQMMHAAKEETLTDSMKMYQWGLEAGQPDDGQIGVQPEWFYKGTGLILKGHGEPLVIPAYANDGGEEPEVAGVYVVNENGQPYRVGFTTANEFSDHVMERKNYLYLAPSKIRGCAIGPELVLDIDFSNLEGSVKVIRNQEDLWTSQINTGEKNMAHSLANLEYHHFKYEDHRQPFQVHIHFFGADAFSFGSGIKLQGGDIMEVEWKGLGRALKNPVLVEDRTEKMIEIQAISKNH
ncbi:AraD1 family protein [Lacibacter sp. H375]|uniref:AraD1 family protein n=1 Tax=Lacibacter sp. H375 TaxID=3133424 RepID=UPI0030C15AF6